MSVSLMVATYTYILTVPNIERLILYCVMEYNFLNFNTATVMQIDFKWPQWMKHILLFFPRKPNKICEGVFFFPFIYVYLSTSCYKKLQYPASLAASCKGNNIPNLTLKTWTTLYLG